MSRQFRRLSGGAAAFSAAALLLAACSGGGYRQTAEDAPPPSEVGGRKGNLERYGADGTILDIVGGSAAISIGGDRGEAFAGAVNKHLWQASLETLDFLPISSTDPFTGVIATDWGAAPGVQGERFKVTAYVTDTALTPQALRVAVFREIRAEGGVWTPAPVAQETPRQLEDSILVRARQLRVAEAEAG
ncbi:DUF3576 domain-containing protein [Rubrimonas cliftonensis]|uniref:DUF3576 domain-containing protein n=1 Tax=Rubrimonas cliftonensis TaxID=89524 RepID=A0A1H4EDV6_9RHOB|nr:DUF3576 domain-containing protein [Rubrimonas cliftonensis]SEA83007.1 protein of unknown function [Rubrimonas cliftonensis]